MTISIASLPPRVANNNGPSLKQSAAAIQLAGEIQLDIDQEALTREVPASLVKESLFIGLIPSLMDDPHGHWSVDDLTEAVRRAAESWADLRGRGEANGSFRRRQRSAAPAGQPASAVTGP